MTDLPRPAITFTYCTQCNWMLRTAWMAQELLQSFGQDIASVTLVPGTGGIFRIEADGALLWDRKDRGGFPDSRQLKQMIRDHAWPDRTLGHTDRTKSD
ncbi:SelT/SelW/SelH family protein [Gemmobacter sp.]|uniref:SelT/SelW/SelH family protein n=1 Tax=Gemmobacter sp. TaxID=1898957 RepID=UPI002B000477|nr:SelT/SelW/SelH family protein [Gemmobacter sp.]